MRHLESRKGNSLLVALIAIVMLSGLAIVMVKRGTHSMKDTVNFKKVQSSFTAAEAGLEHGRKLLNDGVSDTWDDELTLAHQIGPDNVWNTADDVKTPFIATTTLSASQTYTVSIEDNNDDKSMNVDYDGLIWLISTGTSGTKTTTLKVLVQNDSQDSHISQEHYGERSLGHAKGEGRNVANNKRGTL